MKGIIERAVKLQNARAAASIFGEDCTLVTPTGNTIKGREGEVDGEIARGEGCGVATVRMAFGFLYVPHHGQLSSSLTSLLLGSNVSHFETNQRHGDTPWPWLPITLKGMQAYMYSEAIFVLTRSTVCTGIA